MVGGKLESGYHRCAKPRILTVHAFEASQHIFGIAAFASAVADVIRHALYGRTRRVRPRGATAPDPT